MYILYMQISLYFGYICIYIEIDIDKYIYATICFEEQIALMLTMRSARSAGCCVYFPHLRLGRNWLAICNLLMAENRIVYANGFIFWNM